MRAIRGDGRALDGQLRAVLGEDCSIDAATVVSSRAGGALPGAFASALPPMLSASAADIPAAASLL